MNVDTPAVQGEPVAWVTADTVDGQTVNGKPRRIWWENNEGVGIPIYTAPQPAPNKLNADREHVTEVEAPSHSLPNWSECNIRVSNSEWLKDNDRKPEHDSLTANPLHEFIYEYDDSDAYKSAWFLHRLEKLIGFIRSEQVPAPNVAELQAELERERKRRFDGNEQSSREHREDVAELVEALEAISSWVSHPAATVARKALAAHRKQGGE